jgi:SNF2 family DNA or RNA helicase
MEANLKSQGRPSVQELEQEEARVAEENNQERCAFLAGHRPRDQALASVLASCVDGEAGVGSLRHWEAFTQTPLSAREAQDLLDRQVKEQVENLMTFCAAVASQEYFDRVKKALVTGFPDQRCCSSCGEQGVALTRFAITPCAHTFCTECLRHCVERNKACSYCHQPLAVNDVRPLVEDTAGTQDGGAHELLVVPEGTANDSKTSGRFTRFGSKLFVLAQKLHELRQQDSAAKAILFVQFDDLKMQVAASLREAGVPTAQLRGSVSQRANIIRDWQENPDSRTFVLLLSLAESASGTNLTSGSHIVFLHPMLASTSERAAAQELQAIGRARRHGQQRKTLYVWRFISEGTVEKAITGHHQVVLQKHEEECQARSKALAEAGTGAKEDKKRTGRARGRA